MGRGKGGKKDKSIARQQHKAAQRSGSESSNNSGQDNQLNKTTREEEISTQVDSLSMWNDIKKEHRGHIALLKTLIGHTVDINLFGDQEPSINGVAKALHKEEKEDPSAQVDGKLVNTHVVPLSMIDYVKATDKPRNTPKDVRSRTKR